MPSNEVEAIRKEVGCKCRGIILRFSWDWPLVLEQSLAQNISGGSVWGRPARQHLGRGRCCNVCDAFCTRGATGRQF